MNRKLWLYIGLLVFALLLMYGLYTRTKAGQGQSQQSHIRLPRDYAQIDQEGVLRILTGYNAYSHETNKQGEQTGLVYDMAKRISSLTKWEVQVVLENNQAKGLEMLRRGEVDLIAYPQLRTMETDTTQFTFIRERISKPIYLVQRSDSSKISQQYDLAGKTITLPQGSSYALFLKHLSEEMGDSIRIAYDSIYGTEQLLLQVSAGRIDYAVCSTEEAQEYRKRISGLDFSLPLSYSLREGWLMRRTSPALRDSLSHWLQ